MTTSASEFAARDRSYTVRRTLNGNTSNDVRGRWDAVLLVDVPWVGPAGTEVVLLSTSNAGFRGIEGHILAPVVGHATVSLGDLDIKGVAR